MEFMGKRVLLAEDNSLSAEIARVILEDEGFLVDCVGNGQKAVDTYRRTDPFFYDLIILDIRMPLMDGWEAAREIRSSDKEDHTDIPIIAMTGEEREEEIKKMMACGMNSHISKPIDRNRLFQVLRGLLNIRS